MASFQVIKRGAIPSTAIGSSGELRDFRWSDALSEFMPAASRLSMRWLQLAGGDVLEPRMHTVQTLLIVCAGSGEVTGDLRAAIIESDMLVIPAGRECGLIARSAGLTAIVLELGEGPAAALVPSVNADESEDVTALKELLAYSAARQRAFEQSRLFALLDGGAPENSKQHGAVLDALEAWSAGTEGLLFGDQAVGTDEGSDSTAPPSVRKEMLGRRQGAARSWPSPRRDSIIAAITNWFAYQNNVLDTVERMAITHLVVEPARAVCARLTSTFRRGARDPHFGRSTFDRAAIDNMMRHQSARTYVRLRLVVQEAWDMLDAMADRVVELIRAA